MKKIVLLTSKDTDFIHDEAVRILSSKFEIVQILRLNRHSPKLELNQLFNDSIVHIDYLFNFLSPKKVPISILNKIKIASINFHPGSFKYPGVGSASYAIYNDDDLVGVCAHYMNEKIDDGGIFAERFFKRDSVIGCQELFEQCLNECVHLLEDVADLLIKNEKPSVIRQWSRPAISRREFEDWMITDPNDELETIRKIRALSHPKFPGPFIKVNNNLLFTFYKKITPEN